MAAGPDTKSGIDAKRLGSRARVGHAWRRAPIRSRASMRSGWVRVPEPDTHDGGPDTRRLVRRLSRTRMTAGFDRRVPFPEDSIRSYIVEFMHAHFCAGEYAGLPGCRF
jgi:hypothetical protein